MPQFILINKPAGPTSHDVVNFLRQITGEKRIGHAGTLDPFASGLLLLAIGRESTRELGKFVGLDKEYVATLQLGAISNTYDKTGDLRFTCLLTPERSDGGQVNYDLRTMNKEKIEKILAQFIGEQTQIPPMFSAKKINGKKLYQLARQGKVVERKACPITIYQLKLNKFQITNYQLQITVSCSSGTYIRSLAHDIGRQLGCGAYVKELQRTKIGHYLLINAIDMEKLTTVNWPEFCFN